MLKRLNFRLLSTKTPVRRPEFGYGNDGICAHTPTEQLNRVAHVFNPNKNPCRTGSSNPQYFKIEFELENSQSRWVNPFMGYHAGSDPNLSSGARNYKFASADDAKYFLLRQGYKEENIIIHEKAYKENFEGKKQYGHNFLNYHVQNRRQRAKDSDTVANFAKSQFNHPERGKSAWVNLKHTDYGNDKWNDDYKHAHSAENWIYTDVKKAQEQARRIGK
eukprot:snap_masked-scaffold_6-processed-gene-13.36-mRNA-1 protein AED:1.00 eAED:1.00 QI:0/-1/0/0/-1/1/1/0/218